MSSEGTNRRNAETHSRTLTILKHMITIGARGANQGGHGHDGDLEVVHVVG